MNKKTMAKAIISLLLVATPLTGMAKKFDKKLITNPKKIWTIEFNENVDPDTVNNETVYLQYLDENNESKDYIYNRWNSMEVDSNKVEFKAGSAFDDHVEYILVVDGIKSDEGASMEKTSMKFQMKEEKKNRDPREDEKALDIITSEILDEINLDQVENDYGRVFLIENWVTLNTSYDWGGADSDTASEYERTALGALDMRRAVCEGFARGFKALAEKAGYETKYVLGWSSDGFHAWNAVKINHKWYYIDPTSRLTFTSEEGMIAGGYKFYREPKIECEDNRFDMMRYNEFLEAIGLDVSMVRDWDEYPSEVEVGRYR